MKKESNEWFHILSVSPNAILVTDADATIVFVNKAWETLTGYTFDEVKGKDPKLLQSGKTPTEYYKKLWKALSNGQPFVSDEVIDKRKDGSLYQIHSTIYPVHDDGKIVYFVQVQQDITERIRLDRLKSEFFSVISHELKTPITVLKLLIQTRMRKAKKDGGITVTVDEMNFFEEELDKLTDLINDMLDTSRIETNKMRMSFEVVNMNELIQNTIHKMLLVANHHAINFINPAEIYMVVGDKNRIEQVLINFLTNAIKYSSEKTPIEIAITKKKSQAVVSVKDQGIGIPKENQRKIFEKFYQVKSKKGFGLGLYISKEIIKRHKGKIWVESELGKGSTFYFSLPLVA